MKTYAVDFESSYTKDRSIGTHGTIGYAAHPDTDIFMVAIVGEEVQYVGPPEEAPWDLVRGQRVIAHNFSFEFVMLRECERRGIIKEPLNETGFCTANLAAYLQAPRNLLDASRELLGIQLDKTTRDKFKNKNFHTLPDAIKAEIRGYALLDAKASYMIWEKFGHLWPEHEQLLSAHTTLMGHRGIPANEEAIENGIRTYKEILWGLEKLIPWAGTNPVLSLPQLRDACRKAGIPAPESTAKDDEDFQVWADTYASKVPFVAAVSQYRSTNRSLNVLEAMQVRTLEGRVRYGLKYCGAVPTFRWSGDTGLNCVTGGHEVLTRRGWVDIALWNPALDEIAQWHPNGNIDFTQAEKVCHTYTGEIIDVTSCDVTIRATPDHRVPCGDYKGRHQVKTAQAFLTGRVKVPTSGRITNATPSCLNSDNRVRLMVALAADGYDIVKRGKLNGSISFGFRRERKIARLKELLTLEGIAFNVKEHTYGPKTTTYFHICGKDRPDWWKKGFADWVLRLSAEQLDCLIAELPLWDGFYNHNSGAIQFTSIAKSEAEWVKTAAHLSGRCASINAYKRNTSTGVLYHVYIKGSGVQKVVDNGKGSTRVFAEWVENTLVYCPQVPSSFWLVRYKDKIHVTGNCQNFPREPVGGIDIRTMFEAPAGRSFISADMSQIEPRIALWLTGNNTQLEKIRQGMCVYEVHARQTMGYNLDISLKEAAKKDEKYAKVRQAAKARVLGLSYGQYSRGFQAYAKTFGLELTLDQADHEVKQFRNMNPLLVSFWQSLELGMKQSRGGTFKLENPNGRTMQYFDVTIGRNAKGFPDYRARTVMGGVPTYYTSGKLFNNCLAGSTEILTPSGWKPLMSVLPEDLIWDGLEYVPHEGLLNQGEQSTLLVHGVQATPDHKFLTPLGWVSAEVACNLPIKEVSSLYGTNKPIGKEVWSLASAWGICLKRGKRLLGSALRLREDRDEGGERTSSEESPHSWVQPPMRHFSKPTFRPKDNSREEWDSPVYCLEKSAGSNSKPKTLRVQKLWGSGYSGLRSVAGGLCSFFAGHGGFLGERIRARSNRQRAGVFPRELPLDSPKGESPQQEEYHSTGGLPFRLAGAGAEYGAEVFHSALSHSAGLALGKDYQDPCGPTLLRDNPRNTSASSSQGGIPFRPDRQFIQREDGSRDTREAIPSLAEEFNRRAGSRSAPNRATSLHGSPAQEIGLAPRALVETCLTPVYDLLNCGPRHRFVVRAHVGSPPLMASNCCQGIARDVFAEKITEIEYKLGLPVCLTVHDEVLVEVDAADAKDAQREITRVMATSPEWMTDIPLASDCNIMQAYEK